MQASTTRVHNQRRTAQTCHTVVQRSRHGHLFGYARVSTTDQQPTLQVDALTARGCYRVFTETASGARADRPILDQVLDQLRPGDTLVVDTLVVWKLDGWAGRCATWSTPSPAWPSAASGCRSLQETIDTTTPSGKPPSATQCSPPVSLPAATRWAQCEVRP
jgi:hypothetical protein